MNPVYYYFYKLNPPEILPFNSLKDHPLGTHRYSKVGYYPWTRLIETRQGLIWAKVANRNVPKKFRVMLLLLGVT